MTNKTRISEVSYKRTFNLGNYESEAIELTLNIADDDEKRVAEHIESLRKATETYTLKYKAKEVK